MPNATRATKVLNLYKRTRWIQRDTCKNSVTKEKVDRGYRLEWGDTDRVSRANISADGDILFYRNASSTDYVGSAAQPYASVIDARLNALDVNPEAGSSARRLTLTECGFT